jgi:hypothetical protein
VNERTLLIRHRHLGRPVWPHGIISIRPGLHILGNNTQSAALWPWEHLTSQMTDLPRARLSPAPIAVYDLMLHLATVDSYCIILIALPSPWPAYLESINNNYPSSSIYSYSRCTPLPIFVARQPSPASVDVIPTSCQHVRHILSPLL